MKNLFLTALFFLFFNQVALSAENIKGSGDAIIAINSESWKSTNLQIPCVRFVNLRTLAFHNSCGFETLEKTDDKIARYYQIFRVPEGEYSLIDYTVSARSQGKYFYPKLRIEFKFTAKSNQVNYFGAWRSEALDFVENAFTYKTKSAGVSVRDLIKTDEPLIRGLIKDQNVTVVNFTNDILNKPHVWLINGMLLDESGSDFAKMASKEIAEKKPAPKVLDQKETFKVEDVPAFIKQDKLSIEDVSEKLRMKSLAFFNDFKKNFGVVDNPDKKMLHVLKSDLLDTANQYTRNITIQYTPIDEAIGYEKLSIEDRFPFNSIPDFSKTLGSKITLRGLFDIDDLFVYGKDKEMRRRTVVDFDYEFNENNKEFVINTQVISYSSGGKEYASKYGSKITCFQIKSEELKNPLKYKEPVIHFNCNSNDLPEIVVFLRNSQIFAVERTYSLNSANIYEMEVKTADLKEANLVR